MHVFLPKTTSEPLRLELQPVKRVLEQVLVEITKKIVAVCCASKIVLFWDSIVMFDPINRDKALKHCSQTQV